MIETLLQLKEALTKLTLLLIGLSSSLVPVSQMSAGDLVLGGISQPIQIDSTPVISKLDKFEVPFSEKVPQEGESKVEMLKDYPKVIFSRWGGEVQMGVEYKKVTANAQKLQSSNEVKWGVGNEVVYAYKIDDENFEIEIELKAKPNHNDFCYEITSNQNLNWYKQFPLWQEQGLLAPTATCTDTDCDTDGDGEFDIYRSTNVVNSFAVYYGKSNHKIGSLNYATGKAFHRYRIQATDADGNQVWGDTTYDSGELCDIIPIDWLETAKYPVKL